MLISLKKLCSDYNFIPKGVLHIGAHQAEELPLYMSLGIEKVIWIEACPEIFKTLKQIVSEFPKQKAYNYLISNVDGQEHNFYITNNGQSSSLLELGKHKTFHPEIHVTNVVVLKSKKGDTFIEDNKINMGDYNFLNLDIQGAELLALQGLKNNLEFIDYIYTEINTGEVYKNCAKVYEIDEFLKKYGFERVETSMTSWEWGDAFYIKENLKKDMKIGRNIHNKLKKLTWIYVPLRRVYFAIKSTGKRALADVMSD